MLRVHERILTSDDLAAEEVKKEEEKAQTKLVADMQEYGDIRVPKTWKQPPALMDLKHDIEHAEIEHSKEVARINHHLDFYHTSGRGRPKKVKGRSDAQPRLIRKAAEWRYANLSEPFLDSPQMFKGEPTTYYDVDGTKQATLVLNHQMKNQIEIVDFVDDYIKDLVDTGTAIIRTSWDFEEQDREVEQEVVRYVEDPRLENTYARLIKLMQTNPKEFRKHIPPDVAIALRKSLEENKTLRRVVVKTEKVTIKETITNKPNLTICDYNDVIPDPTCRGKQEKMKFCGYRFRTTLADLRMDPEKYHNLEKIRVTPAIIAGDASSTVNQGFNHPEEEQDDHTFEFRDPNRQPIEGIEYWGYVDVRGEGTLTPVVFTWIGDVLIRAEENPYPHKKIPFRFVPYLKRRKSLYGEPDGALLEEDQKISGAITRGVIDIMAKNANGQRGLPKGALDYSNMKLFRQGKDYEFNPGVTHGRDGIAQITKFAEIPQSALQIKTMAENDIKEMTGTGQSESKNHGSSLGTQLDQQQFPGMSRAARRELGILRRISAGIIDTGLKICSMNKEFLNDEEIIRITDDEFAVIDREQLDCRYDLSLSISTAEDDATKASELAFMLQTGQKNMDGAFVRELLADIADLRRMPDKAEKYRNFQPQPDPLEQKKSELEILKLQKEIEEIQSRIAENYAESTRERANAGKLEKEGNLAQSKADAVDLQFTKDRSGQAHAEKKDEIKAQSEGNIELEREKARLENDKPVDNLQDNLTDEEDVSNFGADELPDPAASPEQLLQELEELDDFDSLTQ